MLTRDASISSGSDEEPTIKPAAGSLVENLVLKEKYESMQKDQVKSARAKAEGMPNFKIAN